MLALGGAEYTCLLLEGSHNVYERHCLLIALLLRSATVGMTRAAGALAMSVLCISVKAALHCFCKEIAGVLAACAGPDKSLFSALVIPEVVIHSLPTHCCRAVEGDDWSSVIDGQTAQTIEDSGSGAEAPTHPASTPFARASVHRSIGAHAISAQRIILSS